MRQFAVLSAAIMLALVFVVYAPAQHTLAAKFDLTKTVSATGTVTQVEWTNPNVHVIMKVPSADGSAPALWAVELESEVLLSEHGWSAAALPLGEVIHVEGFAPRDGTSQISGNSVVIDSTGVSVFVGTNGVLPPRPEVTGPTPRKENGQPRLGSEPGEEGYWGNPSRTAMVEDGVEVEMDPYGLLADISDAPRVAPMKPWALGIYEARQKEFLSSDPMFLKCLPPGGPRQFEQVYGLQLVEQPTFDRVFVFLGSGNRNRHIIYTDNREQVGQLNGNDINPVFYGQAVAHWDGDSFVVDSTLFNEEFWFDNGGLPHTDRLRLIERFTRTSKKTMEYHVTVIDPGAYTRPWTSSWTLEWIPGEMPYFLCQDERP